MDNSSSRSLTVPLENHRRALAAMGAGQTVVSHLPARVTLETTSICNLRCVMCPHAIDAVDRPKHMPEALFERMRPGSQMARWIQLNGIGEPLASPALWYALENDFFPADTEVVFNTNMTLLNDRRIELLRKVKFKLMLNISLDAANPLTYRRIRNHDYDIAIGNIRRLVAARGDARNPELMINMTLMRENIDEAVDFVDLAKSLDVDSVGLWHLNQMPDEEMRRYETTRDNWHFDYGSQGLWNVPKQSNAMLRAAIARGKEIGMPVFFDESKNAFFPEDEDETSPVETASAEPEVLKDCPHPWEQMLVSSSGEVRPCCYAKPIANLNDKGFTEIWNGAAYQKLRSDLSQNKMSPVCSGAACKYVRNMPEPEVVAPAEQTPIPVAVASTQAPEAAPVMVHSHLDPRPKSAVARIWRRAKRLRKKLR
jgi:MoaA/NifB/PqqE/SkfB family radical SAM enzyme